MTIPSPAIHVVDDDASFRCAIGDLLSACGFRVSLYETAKQLLATPLNDGPSCILLDVQMAGITGPQLQAQLADLGCQLPVVCISAHNDISTTVSTSKPRPAQEDFLTKPVTKERLLEVIQRALARYEEIQTRQNHISALRRSFAKLNLPRTRSVCPAITRKASQTDCL